MFWWLGSDEWGTVAYEERRLLMIEVHKAGF